MTGRARGLALSCLLVGFMVLVAGAVGPRRAGAAEPGGERITVYDVDVKVEATGSLLVTEAIDYDFGPNNRHGIYRDIPVRKYGGPDRPDRLYTLHVVSVDASEGTPHGYELQREGNARRLKIGDADRTITGAHRYTIVYRMDAALDGFADHDELYWNAIGTEWSVPIERATVRVTTPAPITDIACFEGGFGSHTACSQAEQAGSVADFFQDNLGPSENVTVVVGFAKGAVPAPVPVLVDRFSFSRSFHRAFAVTPATLGISALLLVAILAALARLAWVTGRDRRSVGSPVDVAFATEGPEEGVGPSFHPFGGTVTPVELVPPDGLRPGQVGTLVDEVANTLDVTATIVDLAVRGYLRIDEITKKGWFGKPDWTLTKLKGPKGLRPYEKALLDGLVEDGGKVKLSELRHTFAPRLHKVQSALYDDAVEQGWFVGRPDEIRRRWRIIGIVAIAVSLVVLLLLAVLTPIALVGLPLVVGAVLVLVGAGHMPRRTAKGTGVLRRVEGFRRFIDESEKERARFAEEQHLFSEYLPYAIVFGATEKWARAFAGLEAELPAPTWYGGPDSFSLVGFSHSIDGFAVTTAGTITSSPVSSGSGSSGFSGGFSGGGGGGGSW